MESHKCGLSVPYFRIVKQIVQVWLYPHAKIFNQINY